MGSYPYTVAIAAISLDGRLHPRGSALPVFASSNDQRHLREERARADAVLVGGGSVRAEDMMLVVPERLSRKREHAGRPAQPWSCVASRACDFPLAARWLGTAGPKVVFTSTLAPPARVRRLKRAGVQVLRLGRREADLSKALAWLRRRGVGRLQCEGGGALLYPLLEAGLVDEILLTLCPAVSGARGAASLADGPGFPTGALPRFRLVSVSKKGDELFLRYRRAKKRPRAAR